MDDVKKEYWLKRTHEQIDSTQKQVNRDMVTVANYVKHMGLNVAGINEALEQLSNAFDNLQYRVDVAKPEGEEDGVTKKEENNRTA